MGMLSQTGCINRWFGGGEPEVEGSKGAVRLSEVERLLDSLADRQVTLIADACEAIKRQTEDPDLRRRLQHSKLANGTAVYDIVTGPHVLGRLADLYVLVELQYLVWVVEGRAEQRFGDAGRKHLIPALEEARRDMGLMADLAMKRDRRRKLDGLIRQWRERNPQVEFISGIRFGNLPELAGKSVFDVASSFFDVLNPMEGAGQSVEEARLLAARVFYYSKRMPRLVHWQTEAALDDSLAKPQIRSALENADRFSDAVDRVSRTIERLPDHVATERAEILAAWDARSREAHSTAKEVHATVVEAKELVSRATEAGQAFERTFRELNRTFGPKENPGDPPKRAFDITEYTEAATEFTRLAREGSDAARLAAGLVDHATWRVLQVLVLFFVLLLVYRIAVRFLPAKRPAAPAGGGERPPSRFYGSPT